VTAGGRIGLASAGRDPLTDSLLAAVAGAATELGLEPQPIASAADVAAVGTILTIGPLDYYEELLATRDQVARRIAWFGEPLPRPASAAGTTTLIRERFVGSALRRARGPLRRLRGLPLPASFAGLRARAYVEHQRQANLAAALRVAPLVDRLVTTSRDRGKVLADRGVVAAVVPFGYHAAIAGPISAPEGARDVDVVVLGSGLDWRSRRSTATMRTLDELGTARTITANGVWGLERDALLRRARVVLDVHRIPGNFTGLRLLLALAAGAVLVTEPMDEPHPFMPGLHYVEAPLVQLALAVRELLEDEPRRRRLADAGQALLREELTMAASLRAVLS
jgi:glycosyltransferase involved in cell wall biosynthesis